LEGWLRKVIGVRTDRRLVEQAVISSRSVACHPAKAVLLHTTLQNAAAPGNAPLVSITLSKSGRQTQAKGMSQSQQRLGVRRA